MQPISAIEELYESGQRVFGESRPQEFAIKYEQLPKDIEWHFIGHLQTNKVGLVVPCAKLIESVDSEKLLLAISKEAVKVSKTVKVLLQMHIAQEQSKQGFSQDEIEKILSCEPLQNVEIVGLMGMTTYTHNEKQISEEFLTLKKVFEKYPDLTTLSMGMSGDYKIAIECGATNVRIGSSIFGERVY